MSAPPLCPADPAVRRAAFDIKGVPLLSALEAVSAAVPDPLRRIDVRAAELRLAKECLDAKETRRLRHLFLENHAASLLGASSTSAPGGS